MAATTLEPGTRFGKYQVLAYIANGGMGTVYKAVDTDLRRTVALKVLPAKVAVGPLLERLRREARHTARMCHPNIVTLFEYGFNPEHALHFLALEFIDGVNLHDYIAQHVRLQPELSRRILMQVVKALDHAYTHGVVHRDIKPANILLAEIDHQLVVKLTDLGLARREEDDDFKVTRDGNTVGTIDYMSPEQARNSASADIRSDIYSLGCTAYHMLAGRAPFAQGGLGERILKHQNAPPENVRTFNPAVSVEFWTIVQKMLEKNPNDRYATPRDLFAALKITPAESSGEVDKVTQLEHGDPPGSEVPPPTKISMPAASGAAKPKRRRRKPEPEAATESALPAETLITLEQARTASAFHQRAVQVLAEDRSNDYARGLLLKCLELDPFNTVYRKSLRGMNSIAPSNPFIRCLAFVRAFILKMKVWLAFSKGQWRKVLDFGEALLMYQPADAAIHLEMAEAAEKLAQLELARWLLEEGHAKVPENADLLRALARFHESQHDWKRSIAFWEKVRATVPNDYEAGRKINDLSAQDLMANGHYAAE
jgi:serine/threonine protein kinase